MRAFLLIGLFPTLLPFALAGDSDQPAKGLRPPAMTALPLGAVRPVGWLRQQLLIQAAGLTGHLDEIWPDVRDSAWVGGSGDGWERGPYWLDGAVPLAYSLDEPRLKAKVKRWADYILDHPQPDGWIGPVQGKNVGELKPTYDVWPPAIAVKALTQYQEATGDPRVVPVLDKFFRRLDRVLDEKPLTAWKEFADWARFRWADLALSIFWLYDRTHEDWLLALADKVHRQGFDWRAHYENFKDTDKTQQIHMWTHGVNTGMGIKEPAVWFRRSGNSADRDGVGRMIQTLDRYHGQPTGMFTCDENLAGRNPSQGSELCAVVEYAFSLEVAGGILGDALLGDRLEKIAFNAMPATFKPDMCAHQYDQQVNQVVCKRSPEHVYVDNGPEANLFGLEPNFGCCTANMHQGWPKFASHLWYRTPQGLAAFAYAPCAVDTMIDGKRVHVDVGTDYPFREDVAVSVEAGGESFAIDFRIPQWAQGATVAVAGGKPAPATPGAFHRVERAWKGRTTIALHFPMAPRVTRGYRDSVSIERGPLVFALRMGTEWRKLRRQPPFADWEVFPTTPWNYGLELDVEHPERSLRFEDRPVGPQPFSPAGAPVFAHVQGRRIPEWTLEKNAAGPLPQSPVSSVQPREDLILIPYGCTNLRVTEFPLLK